MFENVVALCLKSDSQSCVFDKCPLFEKCYPDAYAEFKNKKV
jgi:hypothetical protein